MNYLETLLTQAQAEVRLMSECKAKAQEAKKILQESCDRDWKEEDLVTTSIIVANSLVLLRQQRALAWATTDEPWNMEDAKIRRQAYSCGFQDGFNAIKVGEKKP